MGVCCKTAIIVRINSLLIPRTSERNVKPEFFFNYLNWSYFLSKPCAEFNWLFKSTNRETIVSYCWLVNLGFDWKRLTLKIYNFLQKQFPMFALLPLFVLHQLNIINILWKNINNYWSPWMAIYSQMFINSLFKSKYIKSKKIVWYFAQKSINKAFENLMQWLK